MLAEKHMRRKKLWRFFRLYSSKFQSFVETQTSKGRIFLKLFSLTSFRNIYSFIPANGHTNVTTVDLHFVPIQIATFTSRACMVCKLSILFICRYFLSIAIKKFTVNIRCLYFIFDKLHTQVYQEHFRAAKIQCYHIPNQYCHSSATLVDWGMTF